MLLSYLLIIHFIIGNVLIITMTNGKWKNELIMIIKLFLFPDTKAIQIPMFILVESAVVIII